MHKAFFVSALALPQLTYAGLTQDNYDSAPLLAAQISENISLVHEFGQTNTDAEADAEQAAYWDAYMSQVDAVLEEEANAPYWTDGFTSLSQAEVEAIIESDTGVAEWGQKGGLAQLGADEYDKNTANVVRRGLHKINKRVHSGMHNLSVKARKVGDMAIDKVGSMKMPTKADVAEFLGDALKVKDICSKIKTKNLNIANIAGQFLSKKMAPVGDIASLLMIVIPGATEISNITQMVADGASGFGTVLERFNTPDDGTKKTCWIKSASRPWSFKMHCPAGKVKGVGKICYDKCPAGKGKGLGPACWGQCDDAEHDKCGPLCMKKTDELTCQDFMKDVGVKALALGYQAATGNFVGAVFGAISIAGKLAYPICKEFNTPVGQSLEHEESGSGDI